MDTDYGDESQTREHRAGAWILLIIGVSAIGLGLFQFRQSVFKPFAVTSNFRTEAQLEQERLDELKTKDTDGDGITDFDELHVFNTSPYLTDSDSDGFTDKEELESGNDPNCPEDKECGPLNNDFFAVEQPFSVEPIVEADEANQELIDTLLNPSPAQIRQLLIESGIAQDEVDALDDETLIELYRESLEEVQAQNEETPDL